MQGINDSKNINNGKLEHIFLGTVKNNKVSGYHCDKNFGDERVYAEKHLYPNSKHIITYNRWHKIFVAYVRDKKSNRLKDENGGKSTFFSPKWSRQEVVDCIDRIENKGKLLKKYKGKCRNDVYLDKATGMCFVNNSATTYPLLKY